MPLITSATAKASSTLLPDPPTPSMRLRVGASLFESPTPPVARSCVVVVVVMVVVLGVNVAVDDDRLCK